MTHHDVEGLAAKLTEALEAAELALREIMEANNPDDPDSYRSDDREGCLDWTFARADLAVKAASLALRSHLIGTGNG